jgi:hypothetical protein
MFSYGSCIGRNFDVDTKELLTSCDSSLLICIRKGDERLDLGLFACFLADGLFLLELACSSGSILGSFLFGSTA